MTEMRQETKNSALKTDKTAEFLKTALSKAWDTQTRALLLNLLLEADMVGSDGRPSEEELERIHSKTEEYLGIGLEQAARLPVVIATNTAWQIGKEAAKIDYALTAKDLNALDIMRKDVLFWVGKSYDRHFSEGMKLLVKDSFISGSSRIELVDKMAEYFNKEEPNMKEYLSLLADHNTTRIAEMGHVAGHEEAGVEYAEIVAVMDARTSPICRHLNGRLIPLSVMTDQRDKILEASTRHDIEAIKRIQPMMNERSGKGQRMLGMRKTSEITDSGIGLPPYHFRCRTTTVAHFEPAEYHERVKHWVLDGEVPQKEMSKVLDYVKNSRWGTHYAKWRKQDGGDGKEHTTLFTHYMKHRSQFKNVKIENMADYSQKAIELIRGGKRDLYLAIRNKEHPYPVILAYNPATE